MKDRDKCDSSGLTSTEHAITLSVMRIMKLELFVEGFHKYLISTPSIFNVHKLF